MKIQAIETVYKGYLFRSRLEARWAVIFDALGVDWEYEIEGFKFEDGTHYLPDFFIKDTKFFVEVKPDRPYTDEEWLKVRLLDGDPPEYANGATFVPKMELLKPPKLTYPTAGIRGYYDSKRPNDEESINGLDWLAWHTGRPQIFYWNFLGIQVTPDNLPAINKAILKGRQARFEHGENGGLNEF